VQQFAVYSAERVPLIQKNVTAVCQIMSERVAGSAKTDFVIVLKHITSVIVMPVQSSLVNGLMLSAKGRLSMVSAIMPMSFPTLAAWRRLELPNG